MKYKDAVIAAINREIEIRSDFFAINTPIKSIYLGGGTPSILTQGELAQILRTLHGNFDLGEVEEITLEANPDDISVAKLESWKEVGINRLSIGVQSFDDHILKFLNRSHDSSAAFEAVSKAYNAGFNNLNVDLIYGIPGQSLDSLEKSLTSLLELNPDHISAYCLTIEEQTVFGKWRKQNKFYELPEDTLVEHYEMVTATLFENGYEQYEVSNFSKPNKESRHNSSYWKMQPYLGLGPSAHSFNLSSRYINISNNSKYIDAISKGVSHYSIEVLSAENKMNEYILTRMRTKWGTDLEELRSTYGVVFKPTFYTFLKNAVDGGYIIEENNHLYLTSRGKLIADEVTLKLLSEIQIIRVN